MHSESEPRSVLHGTLADFRSSWKPLALTDLAFKIIAFVVLTPLVGLLFRGLIAISGSAALSDVDILLFFIRPLGWLCLVTAGALWLAIVALELASLLGLVAARTANQRLGVLGALRFASAHAWPVVRVTARIVGLTLLAAAPFLAAAGVAYFALLTEYDINYYLKEKPPAFLAAAGLGAVLLAALTVLLLRLFSGWLFALPLLLFEDVSPSRALRLSAERARGHRRRLLGWLLGWALAMTAISALATGIVGMLGRLIVPSATGSLQLLALAIGVALLVWALVGLAVNLLGSTTFAAMLFNLYQQLGRDQDTAPASPVAIAERGEDASGLRITRARLAVAGVVGVVLAAAIGAYALGSVRTQDDVQIMAHRGSSKAAPENTLAAVRQAIEDRADWIEIDVQETADGQVVVFHDSDFMKLAGNELKIWDATSEDLKAIDVGSWFAPEFKDERVPTLAQVLDACQGKIRVNIELKYYGHDEQLEQRVADVVESRGMASQVMAMSLKRDGVRKMKAIRPDWKVGLLMSVAAGDLRAIDADFLAVNAGFANGRLIDAAHEGGKDVYVWTVNDAATMSAMIGRGVDGLLTDKPALARKVLQQRAQMSAPERLLLELAGILGVPPEIGEP